MYFDTFNNKEYFKFIWKIENFSMCFHQFEEGFRSPTFTAENLSNTQWFLDLFPKGYYLTNPRYIACCLQRTQDGQQGQIQIDLRLEVVGLRGECLLSYATNEPKTFKQGDRHVLPNIKEFDYLIKNKETYLPNDTLSLHFYIIERIPLKIPAKYCLAHSKFNEEHVSFKWHLQEFIQLRTTNKISFSSGNSEYEVTCDLITDNVRICITKNEGKESLPSFMRGQITLLDASGNEHESIIGEFYFFDDKPLTFPDFLKGSLLWKRKFLTEDILSLRCTFIDTSLSSKIEEYKNDRTNNPSEIYNSLEILKNDIENLYFKCIHPDVVLKVGDITYQSHKSLLSARSNYFCNLFRRNMDENHKNVVEIDDLDSDTLRGVLIFIYSGDIREKNYDIVSKLTFAADKYQVESLKEECSRYLSSVLSENNVCDVLLLASKFRVDSLIKAAQNYIKDNWKNILHTNHWKKIIENDIVLATDTLCLLSTSISC